ncbi:IMPACT family protein [Corticimicrobacter populi]|uniref:Thymidylate synthase n=1 Tax=Corticimicrobacter populi TaxID=2175229 RepID=A0A2V1K2D7_9BURK|nr:YigZ family protein [Corticimicrobacter populi]PWF25261.1 thymidylate synthase [Corticimicrobacter populi]
MTVTYTLLEACTYQEDVRKSRFLGWAAPVASIDEAMAFFAAHSVVDATHNCWAYRIGPLYRFNDDGEPGGTAGRPILQAIEGQGFDNVAVLVVRWFGGVKLGAGGLVRAYSACAANTLRQGKRQEVIPAMQVRCRCLYTDLARVQARLAQAGVRTLDEQFDAEGVQLRLDVPLAVASELAVAVADISRGQALWQPLTEQARK